MPATVRISLPAYYIGDRPVECSWINGALYTLDNPTQKWVHAPEGSEWFLTLTTALQALKDDEAQALAAQQARDDLERQRKKKRNAPAAVARRKRIKSDKSLGKAIKCLDLYLKFPRSPMIEQLLAKAIELSLDACTEHNRIKKESDSPLYQASVALWDVERIMLERGITSLDDLPLEPKNT